MLSEESIFPANTSNLARIAVPRLSEKIDELAERPLDAQVEAEYAELDREFMELAAWAPYGTSTYPTFNQDLTSFRFK